MQLHLRTAWDVLRESAREFVNDRAAHLSAAIAYYAIFSLAPLLVIATGVAGVIFGERAARGEIVGMIDQLTGRVAAEQVETMIVNASTARGNVLATIAGVAALIFGATGVFYQLSLAMNRVWSIEEDSVGILGYIRDRLLAFALVLGVGFLLIVSLLVSTVLAAFTRVFEQSLRGIDPAMRLIEFGVSFAILTLLFAALYRYLPDRRVSWTYLWAGAATTSFLFAVGKLAIGTYLGRSAVASTFGAAGSLAVVLIWTYYTAMIFLFGAELTEVLARRRRHSEAGRVAPPRGCCATPSMPEPVPYPDVTSM